MHTSPEEFEEVSEESVTIKKHCISLEEFGKVCVQPEIKRVSQSFKSLMQVRESFE